MNMAGLILGGAPLTSMAARVATLSVLRIEVFYFGYIGQPGNFFHGRTGTIAARRGVEDEVSAAVGQLDGTLCWNSARYDHYRYERRDETEGKAFVTHRNGWTTLAFWDRSVDRRGACNSVFIARGELTFAQLVRAARQQWPEVFARFTFEVVEVDGQGQAVTPE